MSMNAISLFSGAGGDTIGLTNSGLNVIGYSEYIDTFIKTHEKNHPKCKLIGKDICKIDNQTFEKYTDKLSVLFAGFPCQPFSHGGKKEALDDPRGQLFFEFVRATKIMKPKWIIGENVEGIINRKNPNKTRYVKDMICEAFEEIGYTMYKPFILKASDFGVPQDRKRCFFVGSLKKYNFTEDWFNNQKTEKVGLKDIVNFSLERSLLIQKEDELHDNYENLRDRRLMAKTVLLKKKKYTRKLVRLILEFIYPLCAEIETLVENMNDSSEPTLKPPTMLVKCFERKKNHGLSYRTRASGTFSEIGDINLPTKTILCSYWRMPRLFIPMRNKIGIYLRPFTIDELKQIQGFPKDYILEGTYAEQVTQLGNAVPPRLVEIVMKQIRELDSLE
jgi:DNA (cytosine-5)-methyltransferase 1